MPNVIVTSEIDCNTIFSGRVQDAFVGVDEMKKVANDFQALVDCILPGGTLYLNLSHVLPVRRVHIKRPMTIRPLANENGRDREKVKIGCPEGDGVFTVWWVSARSVSESKKCSSFLFVLKISTRANHRTQRSGGSHSHLSKHSWTCNRVDLTWEHLFSEMAALLQFWEKCATLMQQWTTAGSHIAIMRVVQMAMTYFYISVSICETD